MMGGLDHRLPAPFARVHPRWGTPWVALLFQSAVVAVLVVVGQAGTTTKGAYDVFLSMTLLPTFVPFVFLFAAAIKAEWSGQGGGRRVRVALLVVGLITTVGSMPLALVPPPEEPNKPLYVAKVVGVAALLLGPGPLLYLAGKRRTAPA